MGMSYFYSQLKARLEELGWSFNQLHYKAEIQTGMFSQWKKGTRNPSDTDLIKLASVDDLGLSLSTLQGWRAIDEYPPEALKIACGLLDISQANSTHEKAKALRKARKPEE